ncbi:hypothetical protein EV356DRAFT_247255 [Viridothelium virens]|uniref:F-box domain-containing protein n=1 Tax=Viridothelium virens TaxID=1048519 RepID=A0A6A6H3Z8_VIRVR|nr:hypothetical protein EV356DRAFT_247255 [Viridothelium virens]
MSLLDLPAELRNLIYEFVFTPPYTTTLLSNPPLPPPASSILRPLLTCRLIHSEASHLAYASIPFLTHSAAPLELSSSTSTTIPPANSSLSSSNPSSPSPLRLPLSLLASIRHIQLSAQISHLRPLGESWHGLAFGCSALHLSSLTLLPRRPEAYFGAYAEVAYLSQCHTLAYILAEMVREMGGGSVDKSGSRSVSVRKLVVRLEGCFEQEEIRRLVYRSLVFRLWKGQRRKEGAAEEEERRGFEEREGGREFWVWMGEGAGQEGKGRSLNSEFRNLSEGVLGTSSAAGWGYVAMP